MLGNDIIDLRDADARPESFHARFDERVFSLDERRAIAQDANPVARRWAHWGAKEAAYKLAKQVDSTFVFSPGRLVADYSASPDDASRAPGRSRVGGQFERQGRLELPAALPNGIRRLALRSFETANQLHVVVVPVGSDWDDVEMAVEALDRELDDPSTAVRAMAIRKISRSLGVSAERLRIARDRRVPVVELDGARMPLSLSLSHHGGWIGYAVRRLAELRSGAVLMPGGTTDFASLAVGATWTP